MSNDMLNDDELDAVAGGTNAGYVVMPPPKSPPAYAASLREPRSTPDKPKTFSNPAADSNAHMTAMLGSMRSRFTP